MTNRTSVLPLSKPLKSRGPNSDEDVPKGNVIRKKQKKKHHIILLAYRSSYADPGEILFECIQNKYSNV